MPMLSETTSPQARLLRSCWSMAFRWAACAWCTLYWALCAHLRNQLRTIKYLMHQIKYILHYTILINLYSSNLICLKTYAGSPIQQSTLWMKGKWHRPFWLIMVDGWNHQNGWIQDSMLWHCSPRFIISEHFCLTVSDWKSTPGHSPWTWTCMTTYNMLFQLLQPSNSCVVCMLMVSCCASRARFAVDVDTGHQGEQGLGWNLWAQLSQVACSHAPSMSWLAVTCRHTHTHVLRSLHGLVFKD